MSDTDESFTSRADVFRLPGTDVEKHSDKKELQHHPHVPLFLFIVCVLMFAHLSNSKSKPG